MGSMYERLLQLPLFQGLTLDNLTHVLEKVKFHFEQYKPGETIKSEGDENKRLCFILDGELSKITRIEGVMPLSVQEFARGPYTFELSTLFGKHTTFRSSYQAESEIGVIFMHKRFLSDELQLFDVIHLNYRNQMCAQIQELENRLWASPPSTPEGRIASFMLQHVEQPTGKKIFRISKNHLANYVNESFSRTSLALKVLQQQGLLSYERDVITIPAIEKLSEIV